jgi:dTMP kinase
MIRAVLLLNTKRHPAGAEVEVSAEDLARHPYLYKPMADYQAEQEAKANRPAEDGQARHQAMKAELRRERERSEAIAAQLRASQLKEDARIAEEAAVKAEAAAKEAEQLSEMQRLRAENERLRKLEEQKARTEAQIIELRPSPANPAPSPPPEQPKPAEDVPPHKRKRAD